MVKRDCSTLKSNAQLSPLKHRPVNTDNLFTSPGTLGDTQCRHTRTQEDHPQDICTHAAPSHPRCLSHTRTQEARVISSQESLQAHSQAKRRS